MHIRQLVFILCLREVAWKMDYPWNPVALLNVENIQASRDDPIVSCLLFVSVRMCLEREMIHGEKERGMLGNARVERISARAFLLCRVAGHAKCSRAGVRARYAKMEASCSHFEFPWTFRPTYATTFFASQSGLWWREIRATIFAGPANENQLNENNESSVRNVVRSARCNATRSCPRRYDTHADLEKCTHETDELAARIFVDGIGAKLFWRSTRSVNKFHRCRVYIIAMNSINTEKLKMNGIDLYRYVRQKKIYIYIYTVRCTNCTASSDLISRAEQIFYRIAKKFLINRT